MSDDSSSLGLGNLDPRIESRFKDLEERIDKLAMANRALWEIMAKENNLDDDRFTAKIAEIDLRDGRLDGRLEGEHPSPN